MCIVRCTDSSFTYVPALFLLFCFLQFGVNPALQLSAPHNQPNVIRLNPAGHFPNQILPQYLIW
jgi:hypothetical protein